jgi:ribose 5-phosphate isomerase B
VKINGINFHRMKICIASDHAGYEMKEKIKIFLKEINSDVSDYGTFSSESVDYPDFSHPLAGEINSGNFKTGIVICGSGNGVSMVANKYPKVRCALCWNEEIASLARKHNNANILALPARFISEELALNIVRVFLNTEFEGGRHEIRVGKINQIKQ